MVRHLSQQKVVTSGFKLGIGTSMGWIPRQVREQVLDGDWEGFIVSGLQQEQHAGGGGVNWQVGVVLEGRVWLSLL